MAKRAADTELLDPTETKKQYKQPLQIQPRTQESRLRDVVRAAYVTKEGELSDSPITLIAINEDAVWFTMLYWATDESIGLRVLRYFADSPSVEVIGALMDLAIGQYKEYSGEDDVALLCKNFGVQSLQELGVFSELAGEYISLGGKRKQTDPSESVPESELNPARCTILMHCYE